jgi:HAMP domain-containing protein
VKPKGLSLTVKIFLSTALVVVVIIATTLAIAARQASEAADVSVNRVLGSAREAVNAQLAGSANGLRAAAEAFAENANFGALVEAAEPGDALDQAQEAGATLGAKWVQITNASGFRLAKSDEPGADTLTLGERSLEVASALGGQSTGGFGVTARNELLILEAVPIYRGTDRIVGALFAARDVDSTFAAKVKSSAASELDVVFFTSDTAGATVIAASTLGRDAEVVRAISALPMGSADSSEARVETDLRGRHYIGLAEVLRGADGGVVGRYLMLRDRDAEFASFQRLQRSLLLTGGVGILVAALLSLLIANQITRPVWKLVEATRRAADGDYKAVIPSTSKDEIGVLAGAFRGLLADLREKQELVEFLSSADAAKTVQMRAMSATTEQRVAGVGLTPGSRFAVRYEVKEVLGEGGMGTVFKAIDTELGEVIAIKTLKQDFLSQDPTALERFKSEIRLARKISHRNVVRTHDLGENSGVYFITMEYVDGKSLKDLIRAKGKLPLPITLSVGKQLARALEVAHEQGGDPSRHQAAEHGGGAGRRAEGDGLRHRAPGDAEAGERRHAGGDDHRDAGVHGAGAVRGGRDRRPRGHLRRGVRAVRVPDRADTVPGRDAVPAGGEGAGGDGAEPAAPQSRGAPGARGAGDGGAVEGSGGPAADGAGAARPVGADRLTRGRSRIDVQAIELQVLDRDSHRRGQRWGRRALELEASCGPARPAGRVRRPPACASSTPRPLARRGARARSRGRRDPRRRAVDGGCRCRG